MHTQAHLHPPSYNNYQNDSSLFPSPNPISIPTHLSKTKTPPMHIITSDLRSFKILGPKSCSSNPQTPMPESSALSQALPRAPCSSFIHAESLAHFALTCITMLPQRDSIVLKDGFNAQRSLLNSHACLLKNTILGPKRRMTPYAFPFFSPFSQDVVRMVPKGIKCIMVYMESRL
jgi:hypothetical protein